MSRIRIDDLPVAEHLTLEQEELKKSRGVISPETADCLTWEPSR
jgi:hypothetical protein